MKKILELKINFLLMLAFGIILSLVTFYYSKEQNQITENQTNQCNYEIKRIEGYRYIKPLLFVDNTCEASDLSGVKQSIVSLIENYKQNNTLTSASVYIKEYSDNDWTEINPTERYEPGSLLKVPQLITFLKMNEKKPGILDKPITFNHPFESEREPVFTSKSIQLGKTYTIKELLKYMIVYSDNNATFLLNENMDFTIFNKLFSDLNLKAPDLHNSLDYTLTATEFSLFMRAIFNASYLSIDDSEFANSILSESEFKEGILKSLPQNSKCIHKFGEGGDTNIHQLHESAIIFQDNKTYLLTIMTKGKDLKKLTNILTEISAIVYNHQKNI